MTTTIEESTTRVVHFTVEGEFLTQQARAFVEEGNWRKGYSFLMDSLIGIEAQMVLNILQGKSKLIGVNQVKLVDDDEEAQAEIQDWLDFQFGDLFVYEGQVYRPYAYVGAFSNADMTFAQNALEGKELGLRSNRLWMQAYRTLGESVDEQPTTNQWKGYQLRPAFYAKNLRSDICVMARHPKEGLKPVLCEQVVVDIPLWYKVQDKPLQAISNAFKYKHLLDAFSQALEHQQLAADDFDDGFDDYQFGSEVSTRQEAQKSQESQEELQRRQSCLKAEQQEQEEQDRQAAAKFESTLNILREQITFFADHDETFGWYESSQYDEEAGRQVSIRVPHRAFICAALRRAHAWHLMPEYFPRCPQGLKMYGDDRYHSDAWVGAGFSPDTAYDSNLPEQELFMRELYRLQRKFLSFEFDVLARGEETHVNGVVIHDPALAAKDKVLVVATAAPEYADAARKCAAVIVETGSKLAHLAIVSREEGIPVLRIEGAVSKFIKGRRLYVDLTEGKLKMLGI